MKNIKQLQAVNLFCIYIVCIAQLGCKKQSATVKQLYPNPSVAASSTGNRLFTTGYSLDISINGRLLTSGFTRKFFDNSVNFNPTIYFPNGLLRKGKSTNASRAAGSSASPFNVPDSLTGKGSFSVKAEYTVSTSTVMAKTTIKTDSVLIDVKPGNFDTYFYPINCLTCVGFSLGFETDGKIESQAAFKLGSVTVPRDITPPLDPNNFKIRVLNLGSTGVGSNLAGDGTVSLCYNDGSNVSLRSSLVNIGTTSEYIELPYGSYQFRVLDQNGAVIPEKEEPTSATGVAPPAKGVTLGGLPFSQIKTYQRGGIYTLVLSPQLYTEGIPAKKPYYVNAYEFYSDNRLPVNNDFGQVQLINVLPETEGVQASIDGEPLKSLKYSEASDYTILQRGRHQLRILRSGSVLLDYPFSLEAADNLSIWLYKAETGEPAALTASNDFAFSNLGASGTGVNFTQSDFQLSVKYLNFLSGAPTVGISAVSSDAARGEGYTNVGVDFAENSAVTTTRTSATGSIVSVRPAVQGVGQSLIAPLLTNLRAYLLSDGKLQSVNPGQGAKPKASDVLLCSSQINPFTVNGTLFDYIYKGKFYAEHGVFSVAVIGDANAVTSNLVPKFLIISHAK